MAVSVQFVVGVLAGVLSGSWVAHRALRSSDFHAEATDDFGCEWVLEWRRKE